MREFLLRSFMFVPAHNRRFIDKALQSEADALILDVEDSVPPEHKQIARDCIKEYLSQGKLSGRQIFIRINEMNSKDFAEDITQLIHEDISGYMPSKINTRDDILFLDRYFTMVELKNDWELHTIALAPLIETTEAVFNVYEIAHASKRLAALCLGGEDYLNNVYSHSSEALSYPRSIMAAAAHSAGIKPIDTPYLEVSDIDGFIKKESEMHRLGYTGCLLLNPKQIEPAHLCFSPTKEQVEYSRGVIGAVLEAQKKNSGVIIFNRSMVGPPLRKRAENVLKQIELIEHFAKKGIVHE